MDEHLLEIGAALAALRAEPERAARLHGASQGQMRNGGANREKRRRGILRPLLAARARLGGRLRRLPSAPGRRSQREASLAELGAWLASFPDDL